MKNTVKRKRAFRITPFRFGAARRPKKSKNCGLQGRVSWVPGAAKTSPARRLPGEPWSFRRNGVAVVCVSVFLAAFLNLAAPTYAEEPVYYEDQLTRESGSQSEDAADPSSEGQPDSSGSPDAASESGDNLQQTLDSLQRDLENAQNEYDQVMAEKKLLSAQIGGLESEIAVTEAQIAQAEGEIAAYDSQIAIMSGEIAELDQDIHDQHSDLNQRLRVMYETGNESMIVVLLGSENIVDFLANIDMVQAIHESDTALLKELETKLDDVERKKTDLEAVEEKLLEQKGELEAHRAQVAAQRTEVSTARGRVQELIDAAVEDIERIQAESERIKQELAARESAFEYGGGAMSWPVSGTITSEFGMRVNPVSGRYLLHAGIDIGVSTGTPVHAAASGVVIFSGWNSGGYGNFVMIDNGSNIVTCYAHNSVLAVSVDQVVARGEVIAYAGSTGNSTGPHCHFEVRVSGEPQNPREWL